MKSKITVGKYEVKEQHFFFLRVTGKEPFEHYFTINRLKVGNKLLLLLFFVNYKAKKDARELINILTQLG